MNYSKMVLKTLEDKFEKAYKNGKPVVLDWVDTHRIIDILKRDIVRETERENEMQS